MHLSTVLNVFSNGIDAFYDSLYKILLLYYYMLLRSDYLSLFSTMK